MSSVGDCRCPWVLSFVHMVIVCGAGHCRLWAWSLFVGLGIVICGCGHCSWAWAVIRRCRVVVGGCWVSLRGAQLSFGGGRCRSCLPRCCSWVAGCRLWSACHHLWVVGWWWIPLQVVHVIRGWGADVPWMVVVVQAWGPPFCRVLVVLCHLCGCCEKGMGNGGVLTSTT